MQAEICGVCGPRDATRPARCRFGGCGSSRAGGGRAPLSSPLSIWGLWQSSRFARCGNRGCGNPRVLRVARIGVMAGMALPQPPIPQRAEKNAQLTLGRDCHNPQIGNARAAEIATTPIRATCRGAGLPQPPSAQRARRARSARGGLVRTRANSGSRFPSWRRGIGARVRTNRAASATGTGAERPRTEAKPGFEPGVRALQARALPLGHFAV